MDPSQAFLDMVEAMKSKDLETARELALALKKWLSKDGFYPHKFAPQTIDACIASVLRRTAGNGPEPVFSLICQNCDAGDGIESEEQAITEGWSEIELAVDFPQAHYCGLCPVCHRTEGV